MKVVMALGICALCREEADLQESHYVPTALYPKNSELEYQTLAAVRPVEDEILSPLLCQVCETRFNRNGETEVLRHIAPKIAKKRFPLHEKMRLGFARQEYRDIKRFAGYDIGMDMDKFAYFALSLVWRGAVRDWPKPDGVLTTPLPLNAYTEGVRQYLLGGALPPDTAVIVIVCSDEESRRRWFLPCAHVEHHCMNFRFQLMGVFFRVMMGKHLPQLFRDGSCTSPRKCIVYGDGKKKTIEAFDYMEAMRNYIP